MTTDKAWTTSSSEATPATATRPLLVSGDDDVLDAVLRVAAAVGVDVEVAHDLGGARTGWAAAPLVLVGHDRLTALVTSSLPRRSHVVVVGVDADDVALWRRAVDLRVEHVVFLPTADSWLADRLSDLEAGTPSATVLGVVGGCGGAGASTVAAALAVAAARSRRSPLLVDADPLGGGLDLLLAAEDAAGSRWADLTDARGRVAASTLAHVLPQVMGVSVLAWSRDGAPTVPVEAAAAVLDGARRGSDVVVVDLPRTPDDVSRLLLQHVQTLFVVVPARVRAIAASRALLRRLEPAVGDQRIVVRGPAPGGLRTEDVRRALERPVVGWLDHDPARAVDEESGEPPGLDERSETGRLVRRLLAELDGQTKAA